MALEADGWKVVAEETERLPWLICTQRAVARLSLERGVTRKTAYVCSDRRIAMRKD